MDAALKPTMYMDVQVPLKSNSQQTEAQLACPIKFSRSTIRYEFVGQQLGESQNW